jgi:hypothetical protein
LETQGGETVALLQDGIAGLVQPLAAEATDGLWHHRERPRPARRVRRRAAGAAGLDLRAQADWVCQRAIDIAISRWREDWGARASRELDHLLRRLYQRLTNQLAAVSSAVAFDVPSRCRRQTTGCLPPAASSSGRPMAAAPPTSSPTASGLAATLSTP